MKLSHSCLRRASDLVGSIICLIFTSLPMCVIAMGIRSTSRGSIFYRQERVGLGEKVFRIYKFRTMVDRADEIGGSVTTQNDRRITPTGGVLRKFKFDELPQLINVFSGDMSLVGPRPDVPEIVNNYTPEMRRIFQVRPGITSIATFHLRDEEALLAKISDPDTFYEEVLVPLKVKLAMEHVDRNSFAFDLKILCQTIWILTVGRWCQVKEHPAVARIKNSLN